MLFLSVPPYFQYQNEKRKAANQIFWYTEEQGILSTNQRLGIITLLPKGDEVKKSLKNWRPITLLSTLYKLISSVINNRFRRVLPKIIHQDQKGFVDGRYMGEVTRTIYDAIDDAHTHRKKGLIVAIDFEKAFDSVGHEFIKNPILLRVKIGFWSGRKYAFGPGEISPGHEFYV